MRTICIVLLAIFFCLRWFFHLIQWVTGFSQEFKKNGIKVATDTIMFFIFIEAMGGTL